MSALLVIGADVLIKISSKYEFKHALICPEMMACYAMYFVQILLAYWLFANKAGLAIYTNLFVVFYAISGVLAGMLIFGEALTGRQYVGIALGCVASWLMVKE